jgi:methionine synthase I (cobalamin-dependent)
MIRSPNRFGKDRGAHEDIRQTYRGFSPLTRMRESPRGRLTKLSMPGAADRYAMDWKLPFRCHLCVAAGTGTVLTPLGFARSFPAASIVFPGSMAQSLDQSLLRQKTLLADGATGTNLFDAGLAAGYPPELWNLEPDNQPKVFNLNRAFVEAGADIILTNTFGGTRPRLKLHKAEDRAAESNEAGARLARRAADAVGRPVIVAGSMGPTGELFEPLGQMTLEQGVAIFLEQAAALKAGGVDILWIETMFSTDELTAAMQAAAKVDLPVICTLSFDMKGRTMMGISPASFATLMHEATPRPAAFGANCGTGPAELVAAILNMRSAAAAEDVLVAKSNCGIPQVTDSGIRYSGTVDLMADYVRVALDAGARIVGGCCGTTPAHLAAMRSAMDSHVLRSPPTLEMVIERLGSVSPGARKQAAGRSA